MLHQICTHDRSAILIRLLFQLLNTQHLQCLTYVTEGQCSEISFTNANIIKVNMLQKW